MKKADEGRFLSRGGKKVEVNKSEEAFTVQLPRTSDKARLETEEGVGAVRMLTKKFAQVKVAAETSPEQTRDRLMERLRETERLVVHHEYSDKNNPDVIYQITDEIIIKFMEGVGTERIREILDKVGVVIKKEYAQLGTTYLVQVTEGAGANPVKVANRLEAYAEVVYAEPSLLNRFVQFAFPADELFSSQWHLYSKAQAAPDIDRNADAGVYEAWQITKGTRDIVVAVLDDGFELSHPDFQGAGKVVHPTDFAGNDDQPLPGAGDYHGTPCAGVAIAEENGQGCVGAAPGCAFMPVRFPLSAADSWLIEIFQFISARAHIASCSWGMSPGNYPLASAVSQNFSELTRSGGKDGRGLVIVFAAGNYDAPIDATVNFPIRWLGRDAQGNRKTFTASGRILNGYPAHPDVIAVGSMTSLNKKALYSNWGSQLSVTSPSNNFDPTTYNQLPGRGITTTDNEYYGSDFTPGKRYTNSFGGTSSATPLVAGICALVKSANPGLTAAQVKEILEQSADKVEDPSTDSLYGLAKGTYSNGISEWFGYGKVNAAGAVHEAARRLQPLRVIEKENATALAIPDFNAVGIASPISISEGGAVTGLEVQVDISHTWIGDLEVYLVSPNGSRILLHNRTGGSADNIRKTYTLVDIPALGAALGQAAGGAWLLQVVDRARRDVGTLNRWSLKLMLGRTNTVRVESTASLTIPDNDPNGVASTLAVTQDGTLKDIKVGVDITHTWISDLRVSLVTPGGQEVSLHGRSGGSGDNIRTTFTAQALPALAALAQANTAVRGTWTLKAVDLASQDVGKLNSWSLELSI
jgi:subtilisin-like proprotein convertase family protein